jgi:hypothetical protein
MRRWRWSHSHVHVKLLRETNSLFAAWICFQVRRKQVWLFSMRHADDPLVSFVKLPPRTLLRGSSAEIKGWGHLPVRLQGEGRGREMIQRMRYYSQFPFILDLMSEKTWTHDIPRLTLLRFLVATSRSSCIKNWVRCRQIWVESRRINEGHAPEGRHCLICPAELMTRSDYSWNSWRWWYVASNSIACLKVQTPSAK